MALYDDKSVDGILTDTALWVVHDLLCVARNFHKWMEEDLNTLKHEITNHEELRAKKRIRKTTTVACEMLLIYDKWTTADQGTSVGRTLSGGEIGMADLLLDATESFQATLKENRAVLGDAHSGKDAESARASLRKAIAIMGEMLHAYETQIEKGN